MQERVTHRVHVTFALEVTLAGLWSFDTQRLVQSSTPDLVLQTKQIVELSLWNAIDALHNSAFLFPVARK